MKRTVVALATFALVVGMYGCASSQPTAPVASSPEQPASPSTPENPPKADYLSERGYTISPQGEFDAPYSVLANDEDFSFVREETGKGTISITESTEGCAPGQKKVTANLECTVSDQLAGPDFLTWYDLTAFDRATGREFVNEDPFHETEPKVLDGVSVKEYVNNVTVNGKVQTVPVKLSSWDTFPTFSSTLEITVPEDSDGVVFAYGRFDMDAYRHFSDHAASVSSEDELVFDKDYPAGYFKLFFTASNATGDSDPKA